MSEKAGEVYIDIKMNDDSMEILNYFIKGSNKTLLKRLMDKAYELECKDMIPILYKEILNIGE